MDFDSLANIIFTSLKSKIEQHAGLGTFARERAKFEGWLKVEICDTLLPFFKDVIPEKDRIDIVFADWAIELKTVNTRISYDNVVKKNKPTQKNINTVLKDIRDLRSTQISNKGVLFIVFPTTHNNEEWQRYLNQIKEQVLNLKYSEFSFSNKVSGVIYFGQV